MRFFRRLRRVSALWPTPLIALCFIHAIGDLQGEPAGPPSDFIRFTDEEEHGKLQVALTTYLDADGIRLDLIGAVHIADQAYYQDLNERFKDYEAVLFELVGNPDDLKDPDLLERKPNPVAMLQRALTNILDLQFQLEGIDYSAPNLVHADLTAKEFLERQEERGESLFTFIVKVMQAQYGAAASAAPPEVSTAQLIRILLSGDHTNGLKLLVAEQLAATESLLNAVEEGGGTVLLSERNKRVIEVLKKETEREAKKRLAVFYGAAHYVDLEKRLRDLGFQRVGQSWLTAWNVPKP